MTSIYNKLFRDSTKRHLSELEKRYPCSLSSKELQIITENVTEIFGKNSNEMKRVNKLKNACKK